MTDLVGEVQRLIILAGAEPEAAMGQFDVLAAIHGRLALAEALTAVAPEAVAAALGGCPPGAVPSQRTSPRR